MKVRIGEYLVEKGIITAAELELALHRQIIYGNRIGTNLVKLGLISEDVLISLLQVIKNAKGINLRKVGDIAKSVITSISKETAIKYKCIPFEITGSRMKLASIEALKPEELREIEHLTGKTISLYIFPEIQWIDAMKSNYNYDPSTEENLLKEKETEKAPSQEKAVLPIWREDNRDKEFKKIIEEFDHGMEPKSEPAFNDLKEIEAFLESDSSLLAQEDDDKMLPEEHQSLEELLSDEDFFTDYRERTGWKRPKVVDRASSQEVEKISLAEATMMLSRATNREQVAITMLTLACNYADDAALFFVTPEQIKGWLGMGKTLDKSAIQDFSFSLLSDSFFLDMIKAGSYFCGPVAISNNNRAIFKLINTQWPQEICLLPIIVQNRIVALLYMASYQSEISKQAAVNMQLFTKKSSVSFEILIFRMKSQSKDAKNTDNSPPPEIPTKST